MSKKNEQFCIRMGERIHTLRTERGLTAEQLAECVEVSTQYIFDVERGKKCMGSDVLSRMSGALEVSCDYLTSGRAFLDPGSDAVARQLSALAPVDRDLLVRVLGQAYKVVKDLGREDD